MLFLHVFEKKRMKNENIYLLIKTIKYATLMHNVKNKYKKKKHNNVLHL